VSALCQYWILDSGTPAYQAPEMLRDEPISEKVDLYGFGIMLWEMYTGEKSASRSLGPTPHPHTHDVGPTHPTSMMQASYHGRTRTKP
jgi:serine/threonine protein kinase